MASYPQAQQSWDNTLAVLAIWIPGFKEITRPEQLSFDCVARIMKVVPYGFQSIPAGNLDFDTPFIAAALDRCPQPPSEVIVVPDCGMVSRLPLRLPVSGLTQFVIEYDYVSGSHCFGLLDGVSDIFFGFDTGDMLLVDHDERIWFTPSMITGQPPIR